MEELEVPTRSQQTENSRAVSLTKITLCVDILNVALFGALCNQSYLREVEILLPSSTSQKGLHVREVLNRDYALSSSSSSSSNLVLSVLVFILLCSGFLRLSSGQLILACGAFVHPSQIAGRRMMNAGYSRGPNNEYILMNVGSF